MNARHRILGACLTLIASTCFCVFAEQAPSQNGGKADAKGERKSSDMKRESIEWCDVWVMGATEAKLPRVLLIGDSIARSYYSGVEKSLEGKALCAQLATSKSLCDPSFLKELSLLLDDYDFTVIHINNGLHGWDYSEADYAAHLPLVLDFIRAHAKNAKLIWANTTPVRKGKAVTEVDPKTDRVRERNRIADKIMGERNIPVDDLFGPVIDHPEFFSEDGVHFNATGVPVLAERVVAEILKTLNQ
jgi:hypothetical protein